MNIPSADRSEPTAYLHRAVRRLPACRAAALGEQPPQVRVVHHGHRVAHPGLAVAGPGAQQALGGEEGHLGVVGDGAEGVGAGDQVGEAVRAEAVSDLPQAEELDGGAEGVAQGAGQQAGGDAVAGGGHGGAPWFGVG